MRKVKLRGNGTGRQKTEEREKSMENNGKMKLGGKRRKG